MVPLAQTQAAKIRDPPGLLLQQHELPTRKIYLPPVQQKDRLQGKMHGAVKTLM